MPPEEPKDEAHSSLSDGDLLGMDDDSDDGRETDPLFGLPIEEASESEGEQDASGDSASSEPQEGDGAPDKEPTAEDDGGKDNPPEAAQSGEETPPDQPPESEAETAEPFVFLGRNYDSQEAAEQAIRSHVGSVRAQQARIEEMTELLARQTDIIERYQRGETQEPPEAGESGSGSGRPSAKDTGSKAEGPLTVAEAVNWDLLRDLREDPKYGEEGALQYLVAKMDQVTNERVEKALAEKFGPVEAREEQRARFDQGMETFQSLAERLHEDSDDPLYPELQEDEAFVQQAASLWYHNPFFFEQGEYGAHLAVLEVRNRLGYSGPRASGTQADGNGNGAPAPPQSSASATVEKQTAARNRAAASGVPTASDSGPRARQSGESPESRIQQELLESAESYNADDLLGIPDF